MLWSKPHRRVQLQGVMQQAAQQQQQVGAMQGVKDADAGPEQRRRHRQEASVPKPPSNRAHQRQQRALAVIGLAEAVVARIVRLPLQHAVSLQLHGMVLAEHAAASADQIEAGKCWARHNAECYQDCLEASEQAHCRLFLHSLDGVAQQRRRQVPARPTVMSIRQRAVDFADCAAQSLCSRYEARRDTCRAQGIGCISVVNARITCDLVAGIVESRAD